MDRRVKPGDDTAVDAYDASHLGALQLTGTYNPSLAVPPAAAAAARRATPACTGGSPAVKVAVKVAMRRFVYSGFARPVSSSDLELIVHVVLQGLIAKRNWPPGQPQFRARFRDAEQTG